MRNLFLYLLCFVFLIGCSSDEVTREQVPNDPVINEKELPDPENESEPSVKDVVNGSKKHDDKEYVNEEEPVFEQDFYYSLNDAWKVKPVGHEKDKVVLLTIDDAPDKHALEMAQILHKLDVGAIFFVNGHFLVSEEQKATLKQIHKLGFEIGNHTMNHANLSSLSLEEQQNEILQLNDIVEEIIGERPRFFRAPFGVNTSHSKEIVASENMQWMNWTYGYDWEKDYLNAGKLTDIMVNTDLLVNGANLLMHDREWTKEALEDIVRGLEEKGFEVVDPTQIK